MCDLIIKIVFIMLFFHSASFAEIYKWTDDDGNIHYTESPPISDREVEIITPVKSISTTNAENELQKQVEAADSQREARSASKEEKAKAKADAAQQEIICRQLNARLRDLGQPRLNRIDEEGNRIRLTEEQRQADIKQTQLDINEQCD